MTEPEIEQRYRILFAGPAQVGKTTLMCGWYRLAKEIYGAEPVLDYAQTRQFQSAYNDYLNGTPVDPTSRGEVTKVLLKCQYQSLQFELELQDYSGEDLLVSVIESLDHPAALTDNGQSLIDDLKVASWILLVQDPERMLNGSIHSKFDTLAFLRNLPRAIYGGEVGPLENVTLYLSKGDQYPDELLESVSKRLREVTDNSSLSRLEFRSGAPFPPKRGRKSKAAIRFEEVFATTMAKLLGTAGSAHAVLERKSGMIGIAAGAVLLSILVMAFNFWDGGQASRVSMELKEKATDFASRCQTCEEYDEAQDLHAEGKSLLEQIREQKIDPQLAAELVTKVETARDTLGSIPAPPPPKPLAEVEASLRELIARHQFGQYLDLPRFYEELAEASDAAMKGKDWNPVAKDEWRKINDFAKIFQSDGIEVQFDHASFSGPQWWTSIIGTDELKFEVWFSKDRTDKPFGPTSTEPANLLSKDWTGSQRESEKPGHYRCRWDKAKGEKAEKFQINPRQSIWIRVIESDGTNETWFDCLVPPSGPLGLNWLDSTQQVSVGKNKYELRLRLEPQYAVPSTLRKAFQ